MSPTNQQMSQVKLCQRTKSESLWYRLLIPGCFTTSSYGLTNSLLSMLVQHCLSDIRIRGICGLHGIGLIWPQRWKINCVGWRPHVGSLEITTCGPHFSAILLRHSLAVFDYHVCISFDTTRRGACTLKEANSGKSEIHWLTLFRVLQKSLYVPVLLAMCAIT